MSMANIARSASQTERQPFPPPTHQPRPYVNVGSAERAVSVAAGSIMAVLGIAHRSVPGIVVAAVGGALIHRGASGHCYGYHAMDISTAEPDSEQVQQDKLQRRGIHVEQAFLINRSAEELYQYWRNFENLPHIMTHLESVRVFDDRRSHWVVKAPRLAGGHVEWDAEITADEPNARIAWRSLPGSDVDNAGEIRFSKAMGDRGTEVHVFMRYIPPAGRMGDLLAKMFGTSATHQVREDLRNFKRLMETGEIPTIAGQPQGTCVRSGGTRVTS